MAIKFDTINFEDKMEEFREKWWEMELDNIAKEENFRFAPSDKVFLNTGGAYVNLPEGDDRYFVMRGTIQIGEGKWYRIDYRSTLSNASEIKGIMKIKIGTYYRIPDGIKQLHFCASTHQGYVRVDMNPG